MFYYHTLLIASRTSRLVSFLAYTLKELSRKQTSNGKILNIRNQEILYFIYSVFRPFNLVGGRHCGSRKVASPSALVWNRVTSADLLKNRVFIVIQSGSRTL